MWVYVGKTSLVLSFGFTLLPEDNDGLLKVKFWGGFTYDLKKIFNRSFKFGMWINMGKRAQSELMPQHFIGSV